MLKKSDCPTEKQIGYTLPARTSATLNQGLSCYVPKKLATVLKNKISVAANGNYSAYWHDSDFTILQDSYALCGKNIELNTSYALFLITQMNVKLQQKYEWTNKSNWKKIKKEVVKLPITKTNTIDFEFIKSFMEKLTIQNISIAKNYLEAANLMDYKLTDEEQYAISIFPYLQWKKFKLINLCGKSTRGKRLKSENRIKGTLPFVTAGEANEGISSYISNDVEIFEKNTITVDMFGSTKYRNYAYGADDHIAVIHSEHIPPLVAIFLTSAIHKAAHTGKFNYGRNFYAKNADELDILLPANNDEQPNYEFIENFISAIQKRVVKDVVKYINNQ